MTWWSWLKNFYGNTLLTVSALCFFTYKIIEGTPIKKYIEKHNDSLWSAMVIFSWVMLLVEVIDLSTKVLALSDDRSHLPLRRKLAEVVYQTLWSLYGLYHNLTFQSEAFVWKGWDGLIQTAGVSLLNFRTAALCTPLLDWLFRQETPVNDNQMEEMPVNPVEETPVNDNPAVEDTPMNDHPVVIEGETSGANPNRRSRIPQCSRERNTICQVDGDDTRPTPTTGPAVD